jgi:hypothetical protein
MTDVRDLSDLDLLILASAGPGSLADEALAELRERSVRGVSADPPRQRVPSRDEAWRVCDCCGRRVHVAAVAMTDPALLCLACRPAPGQEWLLPDPCPHDMSPPLPRYVTHDPADYDPGQGRLF